MKVLLSIAFVCILVAVFSFLLSNQMKIIHDNKRIERKLDRLLELSGNNRNDKS